MARIQIYLIFRTIFKAVKLVFAKAKSLPKKQTEVIESKIACNMGTELFLIFRFHHTT